MSEIKSIKTRRNTFQENSLKDRNLNNFKERNTYNNLESFFTEPQIVLESINFMAAFNLTSIFLQSLGTANKNGGRPLVYLEGEPGTGKTYLLEFVLPKIMKAVLNSFNGKEINNEKKEDLINKIGNFIKDNYPNPRLNSEENSVIQKMLEKLPINKELAEIFEKSIDKANLLSDDQKRKLVIKLYKFISELDNFRMSIETNKEGNKIIFPNNEESKIFKVVLSSLDNTTQFLHDVEYKLDQKTIINKLENSDIVKIIKTAANGTFVIFILDELSELLKKDPERSAKALHSFFDFLKNGTSLELYFPNPSKELEKDIEDLKEKKIVEWDDENKKLLIKKIPNTLTVAATGNKRDETDIIGFTESTRSRLYEFTIEYATPGEIKEFVIDLLEKFNRAYNLENNKIGINEEMETLLSNFANSLIKKYEHLYEEYKKGELFSLPSLRNIFGIFKIGIGFILFSKEIQQNSKEADFIIKQITVEGSEYSSLIKEEEFNLINEDKNNNFQKNFLNYLVDMLEVLTAYNVGSFMSPSETDGSKTVESNLDNKYVPIFNFFLINQKFPTFFKIQVTSDNNQIKKYYLPPSYYTYLLYIITGVLVQQKFFLLIGKTQEGKSTLANEILPLFLKRLINIKDNNLEFKTFFPFEDVKVHRITNPKENMQLYETGIKNSEGKEIGNEPQLLRIIEEANKNENKLYLIIVDEIDQMGFTQNLNELITSNKLHLGSKVYSTRNIVIIGTMNVPEKIIDNFLSRSIVPLYFSPEISDGFYETFNGSRKYIYLIDKLNEIVGNDEERKQLVNTTINTFLENLDDEEKKLLDNVSFSVFVNSFNNVSLSPIPEGKEQSAVKMDLYTLLYDLINNIKENMER